MKRIWTALIIIGILGVALVALLQFRQSKTDQAETSAASLIPLLQEDGTAGFAQALAPAHLSFPADLGAHDDYQTEWWYYTGNLFTEEGREFGFQLTFFRRAVAPSPTDESSSELSAASDWRTKQVYLAHFTVSDIDNEAFYVGERFSRGAAGLAGAQSEPYRVWLEDWSASVDENGLVHLLANSDEVGIDLWLAESLAPVLQGDKGLSAKGPEPGNASYYYSLVQQQVNGSVQIGEEQLQVKGLAWKDHEWSTSALGAGAVGWDWFSLQLDNGGALMFFEIRREDGSLEPYSSGSYIKPSGEIVPLALGDWEMTTQGTWRSPDSGAEYPAAWRIHVPSLELELTGEPLMPNQELNVSTTYWEGAVRFTGQMAGKPISAQGYVELTGYAHSMRGRI